VDCKTRSAADESREKRDMCAVGCQGRSVGASVRHASRDLIKWRD
jgi:hypothetical protein